MPREAGTGEFRLLTISKATLNIRAMALCEGGGLYIVEAEGNH